MNPISDGGTRTNDARNVALDGLRGLALIGMMAWHAQIGWVKGGFARMTIFFVLAGFLATRSYLGIRNRGGPRAFATFWARRARRLLPVTVLGVAVAVMVTIAIGSNRAQQSLGGDTFSVLANVSNWRFMIDDRSYGAMFENPSAFQHFWSLSVEEQWFLAIPLVLGVAAWVGTRREALGRHVVAAAAIVLGLVPLVVSHTPDQAYFGTHVRGAEFLAGAWLALWLAHRDHVGWSDGQRRTLAGAGVASLVFLLAVMVLVDRNQPWLYRGGMGLFAIPAALVVAACVVGSPALARALGVAPLRWLGLAALSIYALHWPIFQVVEHAAGSLPYPVLVIVQLALAIGIGSLVHILIERPLLPAARVRSSGRPALTNRMVLIPAAGAMVLVLAVVVLRPTPAPTYDFEAAQRRATAIVTPAADGADEDLAGALAGSSDALHLAVFGGSNALVLGLEEANWIDAHPDLRPANGYARLGCGLLTDGARVSTADIQARASANDLDVDIDQLRPPVECLDWPAEWSNAVSTNGVDVALVMFGAWDTADWLLDGDDRWRTITDEVVARVVDERLREGIDRLTGHGARQVILATTPLIGPGEDGRVREERGVPQDQQDRTQRFNDLLRAVAAERTDVSVIEYGEVIDALDPEESGRLLPDGVHPTAESAGEIWQRHLGPLVDDVIVR